jgi:hypothetical protein
MTTLADLNRLSPADYDATPWVSTPDGSWTRMAGAGVNPDMPPSSLPPKRGRRLIGPPSDLSITLSDGLHECSGAV